MATLRTVLQVTGDSTKAVSALERIQKAVMSLDSLMKKVNQSTKMVANGAISPLKALQATWNGLTASVSKFRQAALGASGSKAPPFVEGLSGKLMDLALQKTYNLVQRLYSFRTAMTNAWNTGPLQAFGGALVSLSKHFLNLNDVIRFTSQGITNIGRSLFFFVSIPIAGFLGKLVGTAIDFDDALVRVQKTTGATNAELAQLSQGIRDIAINSASSHVEIAKIAEIIGQAGVKGTKSILELTNVFEMLTIATDMTAESVTKGMVEIANAFQWNLNESTEEVVKLANVINRLENDTASSASEIITAMTKFAQGAKQMKITAAEAAGLSASLVSMGLSESEAGTALRNMTIYMTQHADAIANAMKTNEQYADTQRVINALNEDAVQVFLDVASAAKASNDDALALITMFDIANVRGGRALAALAQNVNLVKNNIALANYEWANATSLAMEYERALTSTKNQLAVLRNNINDVGVTLGDVLLPVINEFVSIAVPALRMFSNWFKGLGETNKALQMQIIAWTAFILVLGPALMFMGQILHAITLINMSFGMLIKNVGMIISVLGRLSGVIIFLVSRAFGAIPLAVIGAIVLTLKILQKMGVDVAGFFERLGKNAKAWGENLIATYAGGMMAGAIRFITRVLTAIANLIASFFRGSSPPPAGPLSNIDKWGAKVLQAYLNGFKNADFSILSEIGRQIEDILTRGVSDELLPNALKNVAKARVKLAKVIEQFNMTGIINRSLLDEAVAGLGHMADEVRELTITWLRYNELQQELAEIEARRKGVLKGYRDEVKAIGASNMTIEEKIAAIREAQRNRDDELRSLDAEQEGLEEQRDQMAQTLEYQRNMLSAMQDQENLIQRIADAMERLADAVSGAGGEGGLDELLEGFSFGEIDTSEVDNAFEQVTEHFETLQQRLSEGQIKLQGFLDAWSGKPPQVFDDPDLQAGYDKMYNIGVEAGNIRDKFFEITGAIGGFWDSLVSGAPGVIENIKTQLDGVFTSVSESAGSVFDILPEGMWDSIVSGASSAFGNVVGIIGRAVTWVRSNWNRIVATVLTAWKVISSIFGGVFDALKPAFSVLGNQLKSAWTNISNTFGRLWTILQPAIESIKAGLGPALKVVGAILLIIIGLAVGAISGILAFVSSVFSGIVQFISGVIQIVSGIIGIIVNLVGSIITGIIGLITGDFTQFDAYFKALIQSTITFFAGIWNTIVGIVRAVFSSVIQLVIRFVQGVINFFVGLYRRLVGGSIIPDMLNGILNFFRNILPRVLGVILSWIASVISKFISFGARVLTNIGNTLNSLKTKFTSILESIRNTIVSKLTSMYNSFRSKFDSIKQKVTDTIARIKSAFTGTNWYQLGSAIIDGIKNAITNGIGRAVEAAKNAAKRVLRAFKDILGIDSPSKEFYEAGMYSIQGFIMPFDNIQKQLDSVMGSIDIVSSFGTLGAQSAGTGSFTSAQHVQVVFNNPVVKEEQDLDRLASKVGSVLSDKISSRERFGGNTQF